MDTFYIEREKFWDLFDQPDIDSDIGRPANRSRHITNQESINDDNYGTKRLKRQHDNSVKPRILAETEAGLRCDARYIIMWGPHKPGKKTKIWEGDGYLSLIGQMAHLSDLKGRLLEEPTILDDVDYKLVEEMGELMIGNTEVQVIELDTRK